MDDFKEFQGKSLDEAIRADPSRKEQLALLLAKLDKKARQ